MRGGVKGDSDTPYWVNNPAYQSESESPPLFHDTSLSAEPPGNYWRPGVPRTPRLSPLPQGPRRLAVIAEMHEPPSDNGNKATKVFLQKISVYSQ